MALLVVVAIGRPALAQEEQTPIDINRSNTARDPSPPIIDIHYGAADIRLTNTYGTTDEIGRVIAQEWATLRATPQGAVRYILVDGVQYDLLQFHFHTPAEHAVNGRRAPMEMHFVHLAHIGGCAASARPLVVLGVFIEDGGVDRELQRLFPEGLPESKNDPAVDVFNVNLDALLPRKQATWRYEGGLTAPSNACPSFSPVSTQLVTGEFPEAVHWFVYNDSLRLPKRIIERFQELFPEGNSRNLKLIGERTVYSADKKR